VRARRVHGTHDVHLVVFERLVSFVHVDYVVRVVYPESETIPFKRLVTILIIRQFAHILSYGYHLKMYKFFFFTQFKLLLLITKQIFFFKFNIFRIVNALSGRYLYVQLFKFRRAERTIYIYHGGIPRKIPKFHHSARISYIIRHYIV